MQPGTQVGHYEIADLIGKGGMGEVYRARDTKLGREVAIKVLPSEFARDKERLARLEREARMLAALNHPNIAAIHGLEESDGTRFLVLELVEGDTLADRLKGGAIPVGESLKLALQIAEALEAAHEKGVVHRDLKPANIKVTPDGTVKVLDFGLAKVFAGNASEASLSNSPTLSMQATQQGVILGTAAYMAPEQARGKPVDRRADVWALGCILYEMLTGRQAFRGDEVSDILASVLAREPDYDALQAGMHPRVGELVARCLEKDARNRWQAVGDLRVEIARGLEDPTGTAVHDQVSPTSSEILLPIALTAVLAAAVAATAAWVLKPEPAVPLVRFIISGPLDAPEFDLTDRSGLTISPDGQTIAYRTRDESTTGIYVIRLDSTEGSLLNPISSRSEIDGMTFSPDGEWIGFGTNSDFTTRRISPLGGPSTPIPGSSNNSEPRGMTWGPDDSIVKADVDPGVGLRWLPAGGGEATLTFPEDGEDHFWPEFLPNGRGILFTIATLGNEPSAWQIAVYDLETEETQLLLLRGTRPRYARSGHIVYGAEGTLHAVSFDAERLQVTGDPHPIVEGVSNTSSGLYEYDISDDGVLVYVSGGSVEPDLRRLVWVDREGTETPIPLLEPDAYVYPRISPNEQRVALDTRDEDDNIWIWDFERETRMRLNVGDGGGRYPVWDTGGTRIAYSGEGGQVYWTSANNTTGPEPLLESLLPEGAQVNHPYAFTSDGAALIFRTGNQPTIQGSMIGHIALEDSAQNPVWLGTGAFNHLNAELSPDGRWIVYQSTESGRFEIHARPFPNFEDDSIQISGAGGFKPLWSDDGTELFYLRGTFGNPRQLISVAVDPTADDLDSLFGDRTVVIDDWPYLYTNIGRDYDVSNDGTRFLVIDARGEDSEGPSSRPVVHVVQGWFEALEEQVPVN